MEYYGKKTGKISNQGWFLVNKPKMFPLELSSEIVQI